MTEHIVSTNSLQAYIATIFSSDKVIVKEMDNIVTIEPLIEELYDCPLLGITVGSKLTVDKFLAMSLEDKELEK